MSCVSTLGACLLALRARSQRLGTNSAGASFVCARKELEVAEKREFQLLARDFARKDGIARVTGAERYTVDGYSCGVASSNARCVRIPVSEVV